MVMSLAPSSKKSTSSIEAETGVAPLGAPPPSAHEVLGVRLAEDRCATGAVSWRCSRHAATATREANHLEMVVGDGAEGLVEHLVAPTRTIIAPRV